MKSFANHRIPELDGLRGVAILLVVFCHYVGLTAQSFVGRLAYYGWSGVDLFFVLSGFLIGGILLRNRGSSNYYSIFYVRRVLRILPVFLICIVAMRVFASNTLQFPLWVNVSFSQDFYFAYAVAHGLDNPTTPLILGAMWSLAVEEKFYLLIAPTIRLFSAYVRPIAVAALFLCPAIRFYECGLGNQVYALALPFGRFDSLLLGVLIASFVSSSSREKLEEVARGAMPAAAIFAGMMTIIWLHRELLNGGEFLTRVFGHSFLAGMFGCTILHVYTFPQKWKWLTSKILVTAGTLSYATYLIHSPVAYFVYPMIHSYLGRIVASLALTFGIAAVSWFAMESRLIRLGQSVKYTNAAPSTSRASSLDTSHSASQAGV